MAGEMTMAFQGPTREPSAWLTAKPPDADADDRMRMRWLACLLMQGVFLGFCFMPRRKGLFGLFLEDPLKDAFGRLGQKRTQPADEL